MQGKDDAQFLLSGLKTTKWQRKFNFQLIKSKKKHEPPQPRKFVHS